MELNSRAFLLKLITGKTYRYDSYLDCIDHRLSSWFRVTTGKISVVCVIQHLNGRWCRPMQESRAVAEKLCDAAPKFDT